MEADGPVVAQFERLVAKHSAVSADGSLSQQPIEGVRFRPVRPVVHDEGTLAEIVRAGWEEIDQPIAQVHLTTTLPGLVRGWGLHRTYTDRLFVVKGHLSIVVYDGRETSPTYGSVNEFKVNERSPGLLVIPPHLFHGWKNLGVDEAFILSMPSRPFAYDGPDVYLMPYDAPDAEAVVPFRW